MKKQKVPLSFIRLFLYFLLLTPAEVVSTWWYISQLSVVGTRIHCDIPGLVSKQGQLCRDYPDIMLSIAVGAKQGVTECQYQFMNYRWNCSTPDRDTSVFGKTVLKKASREAAFAYAISSAGAVHAITRSCSRGELLDCACDPTKRGKGLDDQGGVFNWGGCSDNVKFAMDFARKFIDARENKERDPRAMMNLHNNKAGRRAVRRLMKLECKCHGVSGSCSVRTCWLAMMDFRKVGEYLKGKYHEASKVSINQGGNDLLLSTSSGEPRKPSKVDLVYFERSPDYCRRDTRTGSLGTSGRICNRTSDGPDGCDVMCCGRGYNTKRIQRTRQCGCKFNWCCSVKCQECTETVDMNTCKSSQNDRLVVQPERSGTYSVALHNTNYDDSDATEATGQSEVGRLDVLATAADSTVDPRNSSDLFSVEAQQQKTTNQKKKKSKKIWL